VCVVNVGVAISRLGSVDLDGIKVAREVFFKSQKSSFFNGHFSPQQELPDCSVCVAITRHAH
jgi:hypothetical protein